MARLVVAGSARLDVREILTDLRQLADLAVRRMVDRRRQITSELLGR
jgi:hypothetical protein